MNLSKKQRTLLAIYIGWTFLHLFFFVTGWKERYYQGDFWPFEDAELSVYDFSEFLVYVGSPVVTYVIYRLIRNKPMI